MLTDLEYLIAWTVYLAAAVGGLTVWWRMTRWISWVVVRQLARALLAALLLTPSAISTDIHQWAPAMFVYLFDMLLVKGNDTSLATGPLMWACLVALVVVGVQLIITLYLSKPTAQGQEG